MVSIHYKALRLLLCSLALLAGVVSAADAGNRGISDSTVTTIIGGNTGDGATDGSTAPMTSLPGGICHDTTGNVYFVENNRILKLTGTALSVYAGELVTGPSAAGNAAEGVKAINARFNGPTLLTADSAGNIYVLDVGNNRIRKIDTNQIVTTVYGNGAVPTTTLQDIGRVGTDTPIPATIGGIAVNAAGDIFVASNALNLHYIFKVAASDRKLSIFAGDGSAGAANSGVVALGNPLGGNIRAMAFLSDNTLIYSSASGCIRNIDASGNNNVVAGVLTAANGVVGGFDALYPDDDSRNALQLNTAAIFGGVDPGPLAVDGSNILFYDFTERKIRSFTLGGTIKTVFGEVGEKGQTVIAGFRGEGSAAAPNTPRLGVIITAGPDGVINSTIAGDDTTADPNIPVATRPLRVFLGADGVNSSTIVGDDVLVSPAPTADDQSTRNDDPRHRIANGFLTAASNVVTFIDDGNLVVRQFTVGGNVNTVAGTTNPNRRNNLGSATFDPKKSTNTPMPALGAPIFSPSQVASDGAGHLFFDATDINSHHNIWKYDGAAKTVEVVAGTVVTNGYPSNRGDGGPAATVKLTGLGTQVSVLSDGTFIFAETPTQTLRAVNPAGTISTLMGLPGIAFRANPDTDFSTVKADGTAVNTFTRVGMTAATTPLSNPRGVVATSTGDFVVAESTGLVVVAGGSVTVDAANAALNGLASPGYVVSTGATVAVVADFVSARIVRVDYTNPAALNVATGVNNVFAPIRGLVTGTVSGVSVIFVLGQTQIAILDATTLLPIYTGATPTVDLTLGQPAIVAGGITNDGTNLFITDDNGDTIHTMAVSLYPPGGAVNAPALTPATFPTVAGQFINVLVNGFSLQTNFQFTTNTPLALIGTTLLVGDDGELQYRKVTLGTAPASTFTVAAGTGSGDRFGGADGGPALAANDIGTVEGIAVDASGGVYFTDQGEVTIRKVAGGTISLFAGIPGRSGSNQPNNVLATTVHFASSMGGLAINSGGEVFVADTGNNIVRKVKTDGTIVTVAGIDEGFGGVGGEAGDALLARLNSPHQVAVDSAGNLYIAENVSSGYSNRIHLLNTKGILITIAGGGADILDYNALDALESELGPMAGLAIDADGRVYMSNSCCVGKISGSLAEAIVGDPIVAGYNGDGIAAQTLLSAPRGLAFDKAIGLAICDSSNNRVRASTTLAPIAMVTSSTNGKGAFKVAFGPKATKPNDSFSLSVKNINNLTNQAGKPAIIFIGNFSIGATVGGKGVKVTNKNVKLVVDPVKKTVSFSVKGVKLADALAALGIVNENTVAPGKSVLIPVTINVNLGALVIADKFLFFYKAKFNSGAAGKFSQ